MNKALAAFAAGLALFVGVPRASAGVIILATLSPDFVVVGGTVELDFKLTLAPDPGDFFPFFKGGQVTLFSGDGQQKTFSIAPPGGDTREFTWDVTYTTAGNYIPSYTGEATYREFFLKKNVTARASGSTASSRLEHKDKERYFKGVFSDPEVLQNDVVAVASAPELSTWAMMLIGFAAIGFTAHRRARTNSAAARRPV